MDVEMLDSFVQRLGISVDHRDRHNGWNLIGPSGRAFGFVRFNQDNTYTVYAIQPFADPQKRFVLQPSSNGRNGRLKFGASDGESMRYAITVLKSAYEGRQ